MRLIAFIFHDYMAGGGLSDAIIDENGDVMVFQSEQEAMEYIDGKEYSLDNVVIVDLDALKDIAHYEYTTDKDFKNGHYEKMNAN